MTKGYIKHTTVVPLGLLTTVLFISGLVLSSSIVSADNDSVVDQVNITVPVSCTMSGTGMDSHNANINNGLYVPDIGSTTLHAFCNDNEGFAIYAAGYTGNEIGGTNSNKLVGTTASGNSVIESGTATTAGNPDISNWAMKLAISQDSGDTTSTNAFMIDSAPNVDLPSEAEQSATPASFSQYHVVPNEYVKVAHKNSGTDMTETTGGVKLTTTYAAYISKTQPADTYSGQVIYTLVHPATELAPLVCKPGGTTVGTNTSTDIKCMQDITSINKSSILSSMAEDQQYTLKDKRDGKTYTVSKLKDGNIWMTQNLDLDLDSSKTYTNLDTDLGWNGASYTTASWTPASTTKASTDTTWTTVYAGNTIPESYDPGELYWNGTTTSDYQSSQTSPTGDSHYHLGNYYNWTAAVAMNDSGSYTTNNQDVNQSICPSGWTLPKSSSNTASGSFKYLFEQYGLDSSSYMTNPYIWNTAIKLPLSGGWCGSLVNVGYYGGFWSPVVHSSHSYSAHATYSGHVDPVYFARRLYGFPVRCVAR